MGRVKRVLTGKSEIVLNKGGSIAAPTFFAHFSFHVTSATIFVACTAISWPQFLDNSALKLEPQTPNEPNFSHQASFDRITLFAPFIFPVVCENVILTVKLWTTVGWEGVFRDQGQKMGESSRRLSLCDFTPWLPLMFIFPYLLDSKMWITFICARGHSRSSHVHIGTCHGLVAPFLALLPLIVAPRVYK